MALTVATGAPEVVSRIGTESETVWLPSRFATSDRQPGYHAFLRAPADVAAHPPRRRRVIISGRSRPPVGLQLVLNPPEVRTRANAPTRAQYLWLAAVVLASEGRKFPGRFLEQMTEGLPFERKTLYRHRKTALEMLTAEPHLRGMLDPVVAFIGARYPNPAR
jgi:hypothetical protein